MPNYSSTVIAGHIGKQPELKYTKTGKAVCEFSVATSRGPKENRVTTWHTVQVWEKLAEAVGKLSKGTPVIVIGELQTRTWESQDGRKNYKTFISGQSVAECLGYGDGQPKPTGGSQASGSLGQPLESSFDFDGPDSIPF